MTLWQFNSAPATSRTVDARGGVEKLFQIHDPPTPVGATFAGLAVLNGRTIASLAADFRSRKADSTIKRVKVSTVVKDFLAFMRRELVKDQQEQELPEKYWNDVQFLVSGYDRGGKHPSLYRLSLKRNRMHETIAPGKTGLAWAGESHAVERLIYGYDRELSKIINSEVRLALEAQQDRFAESLAMNLGSLATALGEEPPPDFAPVMPTPVHPTLSWKAGRASIAIGTLPRQTAINLASFLVGVQSGIFRYSHGVATVGGRIRTAIVTRTKYQELNPPELDHQNTGLDSDD